MKIIELDTVDSTNNYAAKLLNKNNSVNNTVIFSKEQTKGRGLGINSWFSDFNKNLLFSLVFEPKIDIENNFLITILTSLSICEYLQNKGIIAKIKWPNDIYYQNKKICGILIENTIFGRTINKSIIGVGLNINQNDFPKNLNNAISLKNITDNEYNIKEELELLCKILIKNFEKINNISFDDVKLNYLDKLFRYNELHYFKDKNDVIFKAEIIDVKNTGQLVLRTDFNKIEEYYFKEVKYLIEN